MGTYISHAEIAGAAMAICNARYTDHVGTGLNDAWGAASEAVRAECTRLARESLGVADDKTLIA